MGMWITKKSLKQEMHLMLSNGKILKKMSASCGTDSLEGDVFMGLQREQ